MVSLYVGSTEAYSGKNLAVMGIGQRFLKDGLRVGYFKPLGRFPFRVQNVLTDKDAWLIYRFLMLKDPVGCLCPVVMTQDTTMAAYDGPPRALAEAIQAAFEQVSREKDVVLIGGGGKLYSGNLLGLSGYDLVEKLDAKVLLVDQYDQEFSIDSILDVQSRLGPRLLGVIFNRVQAGYLEEMGELIVPFLEGRGIRVFGTLPEDPLLASVRIADIVEVLAGDILCGRSKLDHLVEHFLIGGMQVDRALEYIRKARNNAVIVGGDRADIQLAAIEAMTRCLILTGNLYPNEIVVSKAELRGVPIVVVRDDTYTVAKKVEGLSRKLRLRENEKVYCGVRLVEERVDFRKLYEALGIH